MNSSEDKAMKVSPLAGKLAKPSTLRHFFHGGPAIRQVTSHAAMARQNRDQNDGRGSRDSWKRQSFPETIMHEVLGPISPVTRIRKDGGRPSEGGSFDAVIPDCG
jgi:hypothetical protein